MAKLRIELSASVDKLKKGLASAQKQVKSWSDRVAKVGKVALGIGVGALAAGLAAAAKRAVELAANFQQTQVAFRTMIGDSQRAAALIEALTEFSTKTPFTPEQVQKAAKTLLSFGFAAEDVKGTLKILGDVSAGTGKDLAELAVIFGQIKSAGRLMGQDLLQLINAGFNPLQIMSEKTGKSMSQLRDEMSKGLITFEDVRQAFEDATSAGGMFQNMMEEMSTTVNGRLSTLQGNWDEFLKTIGQNTTGPIANLVDGLNEIVKALDDVAKSQDAATGGAKGMGLLFGEWAKQLATALPGLKQAIELVEKAKGRNAIEIAAPEAGEVAAGAAAAAEARKAVKEEVQEQFKLSGAEKLVSRPEFVSTFGGGATTAMDLGGMAEQQRERARELERSIGSAFSPQGEIASNLARIGGERGIAVARNIPEKQLNELQAIRKAAEATEKAIKDMDSTPVWPGG